MPYFGTSKRALLPLSELGVFYQYDGEYTRLVWSTDKLDANLKVNLRRLLKIHLTLLATIKFSSQSGQPCILSRLGQRRPLNMYFQKMDFSRVTSYAHVNVIWTIDNSEYNLSSVPPSFTFQAGGSALSNIWTKTIHGSAYDHTKKK